MLLALWWYFWQLTPATSTPYIVHLLARSSSLIQMTARSSSLVQLTGRSSALIQLKGRV
jgi:hypothetical protein